MQGTVVRFCFISLYCCACSYMVRAQGEEIRLWPGIAPGSEEWTRQEQVVTRPSGAVVIQNVVEPTVTAFLPDPEERTGTALIVCPGGGFRMLSWSSEGTKLVEWLNREGIAVFLLKYRLLDTSSQSDNQGSGGNRQMLVFDRPGDITNANANPEPGNQELREVIELAVDDAQAAIRLVRTNAAKWNIDPERIGVLGFSAGGGVAIGSALREDPGAYPDFVATAYGPALFDVDVPDNAPPLFIAVAANHRNVAPGCIALYNRWKEAGKQAEMHIYGQGNGPFGMEKQGLPSDNWPEQFYDWLRAEGF